MESWKDYTRTPKNAFELARRRTLLRIDLDALTENIAILKSLCSRKTDIIAVLKGNAYGHGAVEIGKHLSDLGIKHFAVASPWEGIELRKAGIGGFIQVFGNACEEEIPDLLEYDLVPTTCSLDFLQEWTVYARENCSQYILPPAFEENWSKQAVIKVDTGMSRNGCQPEELDSIVKFCEENNIKVHSLMTHFAAAWDNPDFTSQQLNTFLNVAQKYRSRGIKLHAANSAGTLLGYGTDLDFVRPGIAMYGLPPDTTEYAISKFQQLGLRPVLAWLGRPNLVKRLAEGRTVGYDSTYTCEAEEVVATVSVGYADGYNRLLSNRGALTTQSGYICPVVGRVSMDAITVKLPDEDCYNRDLYIIKDDFTSPNSVVELAKQLQTITYDVTTSLTARLARVYVTNGTLYLKK